ncbi:hypothetical protein ACWEKR_07925 [Nocardia sp. NPDC004573]
MHGVVFEDASLGEKVAQAAFDRGLLVETSGSADEVVELMPPLTIAEDSCPPSPPQADETASSPASA